MKQNSTSPQTLTKQELIGALKDLRTVTKQDIAEAISNLRVEISAEFKAQDIRIDIKLEKMELRIDDRARKYNSDILTRFDGWAGDLSEAREDRTLTTD